MRLKQHARSAAFHARWPSAHHVARLINESINKPCRRPARNDDCSCCTLFGCLIAAQERLILILLCVHLYQFCCAVTVIVIVWSGLVLRALPVCHLHREFAEGVAATNLRQLPWTTHQNNSNQTFKQIKDKDKLPKTPSLHSQCPTCNFSWSSVATSSMTKRWTNINRKNKNKTNKQGNP